LNIIFFVNLPRTLRDLRFERATLLGFLKVLLSFDLLSLLLLHSLGFCEFLPSFVFADLLTDRD
jgi:hypothetical protein